MKNESMRRLPPPPLFAIRPPPKPPGSLLEHIDDVKIFNGQCVRSSFKQISSTPTTTIQSISGFNLFLLSSLVICVICCIIIVIFIFICLKKLRKEEKQYKDYLTSGSLSLKSHHRHQHMTTCTRTNEHYKCTSNCCDDYYTHQLMPMTHTSSSSSQHHQQHINKFTDDLQDTQQNIHQYESIPEYILTMTRQQSGPYSNFSRLYLTPQEAMRNRSDCSQCTCSSLPSTPLLTEDLSNESHKR